MTRKSIALAFLLSSFCAGLGPAYALATTLDAISGADTVIVKRGAALIEAKPGASLEVGDRIKTEKGVSATISYPDGSKVEVRPESDFQVEEVVAEVQWNRLRAGAVRGAVTKAAADAPKKTRFLIRSKSAVMGVRGTEFVMALEEGGKASVHTLEGVVDVAKSEEAVLSGQGTAVEAGKMIQATSAGLGTPQSFDTGEFLKSFESGGNGASAPAGGASATAAGTPSVAPPSSAEAPAIPSASTAAALSAPPPPKLPDPVQQKQVEATEAKKADESSRKIHLLTFRLAPLYAWPEGVDPIRILTVGWAPSVPIPVLKFLSVRGYAGGGFFRQGVVNSTFVMHEYHVYAVGTFFEKAFAEVGFGWQFYRTEGERGHAWTATVGYQFSPHGLFNHVFFSRDLLQTNPRLQEYRLGLGLVFL